MDATKFLVSLILLFAGIYVCPSQNSSQGSTYIDSTFRAPVLPQGFEKRQQNLSLIFEIIADKKYDEAIAQADIVVLEAISNKDTINLREAYRLISKAYHYKGDKKQRDQYELSIRKLAVAYGYHVDDGKEYFEKKDNHIEKLRFIYDELQLLEDREGILSFQEISSPLFQDKYTINSTAETGKDLYELRELGFSTGRPPKTLFNQDAVYWVKLRVIGSKTKTDNYIFLIGQHWGASWDKVDIYVQSSDTEIEHFRVGLALSPMEKDFKYNHNLFELALEQHEVKTLYMRLAGNRKDNMATWRPSYVALILENTQDLTEFDGYYHIPDSITHTHDCSQPRRLNHLLNAINYVEDPNQQYSLNDVVQDWDKLNPNFPYQLIAKEPSAYYWAKFNVVNKEKNTTMHSFMLPEQWDDVEVYVPDASKNYKRFLTGSNIQDDKKTIPGLYNIFCINAHYNDSLTIYIKFKSNQIFPYSSTTLTKFELVHFEESQLRYDHYKMYLPYYIMIGILIIQVLYYFIIYFINKERTHLYLMFLFVGVLLSTVNVSNIFSQFQSNQAINWLGMSIFLLGLFKYTETILNIRTISNWVHKLNRIIFFLLLVALLSLLGTLSYFYLFAPLVVTEDMPAILFINMGVIIFVTFALFVQAIYSVIKRVKYAIYFLLFYILIIISFLIIFTFPLSWDVNADQRTVLSVIFFTLSTLGLMLINAYRLKQLREDQAEKEKAQASERAEHQFLANMSHEIRTPMNAIKGMTDILIRRGPKDDQKEYLDSIKQSSDSLLIIINDILDISKVEAGKIELEHEPFSVNELVDNVHTIMHFKAEEKGLELKKDIPPEHLYVKGDATRLRQILINLIGNAIKFTEKGLVTTAIGTKPLDGKLQLHFTVSDTGIGIDEDRMDKIFKSLSKPIAIRQENLEAQDWA